MQVSSCTCCTLLEKETTKVATYPDIMTSYSRRVPSWACADAHIRTVSKSACSMHTFDCCIRYTGMLTHHCDSFPKRALKRCTNPCLPDLRIANTHHRTLSATRAWKQEHLQSEGMGLATAPSVLAEPVPPSVLCSRTSL